MLFNQMQAATMMYVLLLLCLVLMFILQVHIFLILFLQLVPPVGMLSNPMNAVTTKFVRTSTNKVKCPVFVVRVSVKLLI